MDHAGDALLFQQQQADLAQQRRVGAFADEQRLGLVAHEQRRDGQQHADQDRGQAVEEQDAGEMLEQQGGHGDGQADEGGGVLEEDHHQLGFFRLVQVGDQPGLPALDVDLLEGHAQGDGLGDDGDAQDQQGDRQVGHRGRVAQLVHPLVDGEDGAAGEQDDGHDEGPEIGLAGKAEGVKLVGLLGGLLDADEQQHLVQGVGGGVDGLGQHGRRGGEQGHDELDQGDEQVGAESGHDHGFRTFRFFHWSYPMRVIADFFCRKAYFMPDAPACQSAGARRAVARPGRYTTFLWKNPDLGI